MTETGLLIAQVVFLVLLFGFIASVVRSSARQLGRIQPPPVAGHGPVVDPPRVAPVQAVAAPVAPPAPTPAPEPVRTEVHQPTLEPFPSPFRDLDPGVPAADPATVVPGGLAPADPFAAHVDQAEVAEPSEDLVAGAEALVEDEPAGDPDPGNLPFDILAAGTPAGAGRMDLTANIQPRLVVETSTALQEGSDLVLEGGLTVGRSAAADLSLADQYVSHMHARILRRGAYYFVEDLGSTNGTFLNDLRIESSAQLKVHDTLRMGQTVLRYEE